MDVFEKINNILINDKKPSLEIERLFLDEDFNKSNFKIIKDLKDIKQNLKYHPEGNVWNHTKLVIDLAALLKDYVNNKEIFMWAALLHDIGKIKTTKIIKGRYTSYNHDLEGSKLTYEILKEYRNERYAIEVSDIVRYHMHHIYILKELPFSDINGLIENNNIEEIILLFICDKSGRGVPNNINICKSIEDVKSIILFLEKNYDVQLNKLKKNIEIIKNILLK